MHWFKMDIKATLFNATWMTEEELGFYLKILCFYYDIERGINENLEEIFLFLKIKNKKKKSIVEKIFSKNFTKFEGFFIDEKIEKQIKEYKEKAEKNKENANKRWDKKGGKIDDCSDATRNASAMRKECDRNANLRIKEFSNLVIKESKEDLREIHKKRVREESDAIASEQVAKAPVSKSPKKPKKITDNDFDFRGELIARGVDAENADAWISVRAAKNAINNLIAIKLLETQAAIAGMTTNDAVMTAAGSGWSGFKAVWLKNESINHHQKTQFKTASQLREEANQKTAEESIKLFNDKKSRKENVVINFNQKN